MSPGKQPLPHNAGSGSAIDHGQSAPVGHPLRATVHGMRVCRSGQRLMVVGLLASLIVALGCSTNASKSPVSGSWQPHTYRSVVISAPSSWHVYRNTVCTPNEHPGALALGAASGPGSCMDQVGPPGTVVEVSDLSLGALHTLPPPVATSVFQLHGLTIVSSTYSGGSHSGGITVWQVASARVQVIGRGPSAGPVMATLRSA